MRSVVRSRACCHTRAASGRSSAWQSAAFGSRRPPVQIRPPRLRIAGSNPALVSAYRRAARFAKALERWESGVTFANFVDVPIGPRWCRLAETFDRLQQVKARYDPDNLFAPTPRSHLRRPRGRQAPYGTSSAQGTAVGVATEVEHDVAGSRSRPLWDDLRAPRPASTRRSLCRQAGVSSMSAPIIRGQRGRNDARSRVSQAAANRGVPYLRQIVTRRHARGPRRRLVGGGGNLGVRSPARPAGASAKAVESAASSERSSGHRPWSRPPAQAKGPLASIVPS